MLLTVFAITWKEIGLAWFQRLVIYRQKLMPTNYKLIGECDKSFADDLVASRYCKHESSLCATICWDFSCVPTICSSFNLIKASLPLCGSGAFFFYSAASTLWGWRFFLLIHFVKYLIYLSIKRSKYRSHFGSRYPFRLKRLASLFVASSILSLSIFN